METSSKFAALKRFGNSVFTFFSGVTLGLVIGGSVTFYYLDSKIQANLNQGNNEKNRIGLISKFLEFAEKTNPFVRKKIDSAETKRQNSVEQSEKKKYISKVDSLKTIESEENAEKDSTNTDEILADDGSIVKKDEMIFSKYMEIFEIDKKNGNIDSVNIIGNRTRHIAGRLWVEFWKSPLNYRGYKYSRSKLVIYGIFDYEGVKMIKLGEEVFFRHNTSFYRISDTDNFAPFVKVSDDLTLIELNQF